MRKLQIIDTFLQQHGDCDVTVIGMHKLDLTSGAHIPACTIWQHTGVNSGITLEYNGQAFISQINVLSKRIPAHDVSVQQQGRPEAGILHCSRQGHPYAS